MFRLNVAYKNSLFGLSSVVYIYLLIQPGQSNDQAHTCDKAHGKEANHIQGKTALVNGYIMTGPKLHKIIK